MRFVALVMILMLALPATAAQKDQDADALQACIQEHWPGDVLAECTGLIADPCQAKSGGETTLGMNNCLTQEAEAWDVILNRLWPELMKRARATDQANQITGPDSAAETLRAAQRAWIAFRDADCRHSYATYGLGSFRTIAHSACTLELTARRVVDFHARLESEG
ncbi:MAG: DUF1311 domain-containing protein [Paracoccaceae bacterium]|nr:DUF1311 domain-containing protein [Paracoccaceae bacterium]